MLIQSLINVTSRRLLKIKGFSEVKVEKVKEAAKKLLVSLEFFIRRLGDFLLFISQFPGS